MEPLERPKDFPTIKEMARRAYELLRGQPYGALVTYDALAQVLTIRPDSPDPSGRRARSAVLQAGQKLLKSDQHMLINVRSRGYQIAQPNEHAGQARRFRAGARRKLRRGYDAVVYIALEKLTSPKEIADVLAEQVRCGLTLAFERRLHRRKALPPPPQAALPSGQKLVQLITRQRPPAAADRPGPNPPRDPAPNPTSPPWASGDHEAGEAGPQ